MSDTISRWLAHLPSVSRLVERIATDLREHRHVIFLAAPGLDAGRVKAQLLQHRVRNDLECVSLAASPGAPEALVRTQLAPPDAEPSLDLAPLLPEVLWIDGLDQLPSTDLAAWVEYAVALSTRSPSKQKCRLVLPTSRPELLARLPGGDRVVVRSSLGVPSVLDLRLLCRLADEGEADKPEARWREHVLPELAAGDPAIVEALWDTALRSPEEICDALEAHSRSRQFDARDARLANAAAAVVPGTRTTAVGAERWAEAWTAGLVTYTPEHGAERGTAHLAACGERERIHQRLWRGQAALLLPLIDGVRLRMCERLTERYGEDWTEKGHRYPEDEADPSPLGAQLGYLVHVLRSVKELAAECRWLELVSRAREIRNEIAHYRPVRFTDFHRLWRLNQEFTSHLDSERNRRAA